MNREAFYLEIGYIDDDLIQAANEVHGEKNKRTMFYRIAGIAACFCLICGSILFGLQKDTLYFNNIPIYATSKVIVPADENTKIIPMTHLELLEYYGMEQLPDAFGKELIKTDQSFYVLYKDQIGNILYDTNIFYYCNIDANKTLSITLNKVGEPLYVSQEGVSTSKLSGVKMLLASSSNGNGYAAYLADFELNGVSVQIVSDGLSEDEFINTLKEFIKLLK